MTELGQQPFKIAIVYPGDILPITNGSRQRVMDLIETLNEIGFKPDLYCDFSPSGRTFNLQALAPYAHHITDIKAGPVRRMGLKLWRWLRNTVIGLGHFRSPRDRHAQLARAVSRALQAADETYHLVLCSYLWTLPPHRCRGTIYVVDTHDVFIHRDRAIYAQAGHPTLARAFAGQEARFEIATLHTADAIWAISAADRALLAEICPSKQLFTVPPSLRWLDSIAIKPIAEAPCFGFFGSHIVANRLILDAIIGKIWPALRAIAPNATLVIAGTISSETPDGIDGIIKLGPVKHVSEFYDHIDMLLTPIFMMGGINVKIAEALVAGKIVFTNSMGRRSMPTSAMFYDIDGLTGDQGESLLETISDRLRDPTFVEAERGKARAYFRAAHQDGIRDTFDRCDLPLPEEIPCPSHD